MPIESPPAVGLLAALALVLLNGFFVAAEFALIKVRASRLEELVEGGSRRAARVKDITGHLDGYLAATQLGITFASLGLGAIGEPAIAGLIRPLFVALSLPPGFLDPLAFGIAFALLTIFHITLGELVPKRFAIARPEQTGMAVAIPLRLFHQVMGPFIWVLKSLSNIVLSLLGIPSGNHADEAHSDDELRLLVASSRAGGTIDKVEGELASRSLGLGDLSLRELMVPRTEVVMIDRADSLEVAQALMLETRHARLPVFGEGRDDVLGVIEWADLFDPANSSGPARAVDPANSSGPARAVDPANGPGPADQDDASEPARAAGPQDNGWASRVRPVPVMPESLSASSALAAIRTSGGEEAFVIDEYGGLAGFITLGLLLGAVSDERIHWVEGTPLDAGLPLHGLARRLGIDDVPDHEAVTIGGYITELLGRFARKGDTVRVDGWTLEVVTADATRALTALVYRTPEAPVED